MFAALLIIGIGETLSSCSSAGATKLDVVNGTVPVSVHDIEWRKSLIETLKPMTPTERKAEIDKVLPRLNSQLVASLRERGYGCDIASIEYVFGSGTSESVESGDGNTYSGFYEDQLYAVIKGDKCFKDSMMVFVQCFNGTFVIDGKSIYSIGIYEPSFTIEKGKGINSYVDYRTAVWIAEQFNLPLYKGQGWKGPIITPTQARQYENDLDRQAITVKVYPGDYFNLGTITYRKAK